VKGGFGYADDRNFALTTYWRPIRLAALFSLFSVFAMTHGEHAFWLFLMFLFFLLPFPGKSRAQP
jgi:hypothetical protein